MPKLKTRTKTKTQAVAPRKKAAREKRANSTALESQVMDYLGNSRICGAGEIAAKLKRSRGTVSAACKRLYRRNEVRLSRVPREKPLYRFALTGDVVHRGNYVVVAKLAAIVRAAATKAPMLPLARLKAICARLRADRALQSAFAQNYLSRCEAALAHLGSAPSSRVLLDKVQFLPFRPMVIRWWPRVLETKYEQPVREIMKRLDRNKIRRLARDLPNRSLAQLTKLKRSPTVDASQVVKVILEVRKGHVELLDQLKRSGAEELLQKRDEQLRSLVSLETIPKLDLEMLPKGELNRSLEKAHDQKLAESGFGRTQLNDLTPHRIEEIVDQRLAEKEAKPRAKRGDKRRLKKVFVGWGIVAVNVGLAAANLAMSIGPMLNPTIPSAAGTDIGQPFSVMNSVHAGLTGALAALLLMPEKPEEHDSERAAHERRAA